MKLLLAVISICTINLVLCQCPQGAIGVTGAGCGCLSGCNLTSFGGPNCGGGTSGNCTAGQVAMSIDIIVPDGCTFTVTAVMQNRPGCSASGADSGDQLKVDVPGGPKPFQTGASNASITDSYTLAGPATIRVSGTANRADEIITYSTTYSGAFCNACGSILPFGLSNFNGTQNERYIHLDWTTGSELNADYFEIYRSLDGTAFNLIQSVDAIGNNSQSYTYNLIDSDVPMQGLIYYKLVLIDNNGEEQASKTIKVNYSPKFVSYENGTIIFHLNANFEKEEIAYLYNSSGQLIQVFNLNENVNAINFSWTGLFVVSIPDRKLTQKIVVL